MHASAPASVKKLMALFRAGLSFEFGGCPVHTLISRLGLVALLGPPGYVEMGLEKYSGWQRMKYERSDKFQLPKVRRPRSRCPGLLGPLRSYARQQGPPFPHAVRQRVSPTRTL
jgi:hypothetical protein